MKIITLTATFDFLINTIILIILCISFLYWAMDPQSYSPIAAFTSTGSESGENWLSPAAFTALTLNTYFSPVIRPWQKNLQIYHQYIYI